MRIVLPVIVLLIFAVNQSPASGPAQGGAQRRAAVGAAAVWEPDASFIDAVHRKCGSMSFSGLGECVAGMMKKSGASAEAVAFARQMESSAWMRGFRNHGRVDVAWVTYPFRANENQGVLLVNGDPSPIDVDDFSRLAQGELNRDQAYAELKRAYPDISLWPGDRYSFDVPIAESLPSGGSRFHVGYILRNGCHACDKIGSAVFAFDFTPEGKFSGTKLMVVTDTVGKGFTDPTEPLVVKPGREFSLTLAVNPSTGYGWTVAGPLEQSVVKQIRTEYRHPSAKAPGAGGAEILRFKAVGKGKTVISLSYARPWEQGGEPARRVAFVIIVQ